ncbi:MAG TPA: TRAP transporter substrate-binding protein [Stellaceae bacterium]|nr:TRAP transporter substrate-binding protein [Stellaceae bacterium]
MRLTDLCVRITGAVAALAMAFVLTSTTAQADDKNFVMKITLPTINENVHQYAKNLAARVEKDSGGRIKGEVYPASQLGSIPRQIEGLQFGSIQCGVIPPEFFVGVDERFEVVSAPGLVDSIDHGQRIAADPEVLKLMLSLGANKGLHGTGLFAALPSFLVSKSAVRHLDDLKGKKIRVLASEFQNVALERLGATPVAMSLGDVLPAIQQGAIDGAVSGMTVFTSMQYQDAAKYVTRTGQPFIFLIVELSSKWRDSLPADLRKIVDDAVVGETVAINPISKQYFENAQKEWVQKGGEMIDLPAQEQAAMMETLASVAEDVSKHKAELGEAYKIVSAAAKRDR